MTLKGLNDQDLSPDIDSIKDSLLCGWLEKASVESEPNSCSSELEFVIDESSVSGSSTSTARLSERSCSDTTTFSRQEAASFCQRDAHTCITSDGWRLHIQHVYDPIAEASASYSSTARQYPVLMVPGLASSGEHTFDLLPECSLVELLVSRGYDVWVADLRGNGHSQKPNPLDSRTWWTVDDHFHKDVPAVLEYVLAHTGSQQVHWIGHSMGGMMAVGLLSQQGKHAPALRSITLLASGCFCSGSWHGVLKPIITPITMFGFPAGWVCSVIGAAAAFASIVWWIRFIEGLFYWPSNTPTKAARRLMSGCFRFIPTGVIQQFLGSLNSEQGLCSQDFSFRYANPQVLQQCQVPVLGINGSWDMFCPAAGGKRTVEMFGSSSKQFICLGPWHRTAKRNYGHFDIMCGYDVHKEVFPHITNWLEQHDAPQ